MDDTTICCLVDPEQYTEVCGQDPCLDEGCAAEGETCHQAILRAGPEYQKACAVEWARRFVDPRNRVPAWRN